MAKKKTKAKAKRTAVKKTTDRTAEGQFKPGNSEGNRFPPGKSGNPAGQPVAKTQLWRYFCQFAGMTDAEIAKVKKRKLTQVQKAALKLVANFAAGNYSKSRQLARYVIDREEGKALETVKITGEKPLSDDECESIRDILRKNGKPNK